MAGRIFASVTYGIILNLVPMLQAQGMTLTAAVALLGLATGSETDVVAYMIAQRFGRDIFATVLAVIMSVFALLAATGPLLAGSIFDQYGSYEPYLMIGIPLALLATLCIALVPDRPVAGADAGITV